MALPYDSNVANYLSAALHPRVKSGGTWRWADQLHVRHSGSWRTVKQAYVKSGGTWRRFHDTENVFTFSVNVSGTRTSTFNLGSWLTSSGYSSPSLGRTYNSGDRLRGLITITGKAGGNPGVYIGSFTSGSVVYLRINNNCRIAGRGGNGGNVGNGANSGGGTALYTRTPVYIENNGQMWGGGGGGRGGNNGQCVGTYYYNYNCGKNCYRQGSGNNYNPASGGGGGGGAGIPAGSGGNRANNGSYNSGGNGGGGQGCGSNSGAKGGNPGQNASGGNSGSNGNSGYYIDGSGYVYSWIATGDRRGRSG